MKAIVFKAKGEPAVLEDRKVPTPGAHEVRIKVSTTALNPHDQKIRDLGKLITAFPWIPGSDVAGTVNALGDGVSRYQLGSKLFGQMNFLSANMLDTCGAQEYALVDVRASTEVPDGFSEDDVVTMPTNAAAAFWAFFGPGGFGLPLSSLKSTSDFDASKHDLVVIGGGSQVGKLTVQFAKMMGWRNVVVVAGLQKQESLKQQGATHVIDRHRAFEDLVRQVRSIVGDDLRFCINAIESDRTLGAAILSDTVEGHLTNLTSGAVDLDRAGPKEAGFKQTHAAGVTLRDPEIGKYFWEMLPQWLTRGHLKVPKWTVIEGLDVDAINGILNGWRDDKPATEHVHVHPSG